MKRMLFALLLGAAPLFAQIPNPQVALTANIGAGGTFPLMASGTLNFTADANHTMVYPETAASFIRVTSSVPLTATRNLIAPITIGFRYSIENATTGGQSIQVIGSSGTGVMIPNGQTIDVVSDGTDYVVVGSPGVTGSPLMVLSAPTGCTSGTCTFAPTAVTSDYISPGKMNFPEHSYSVAGYGSYAAGLAAMPSTGGILDIPNNGTSYGNFPAFNLWKPGTIVRNWGSFIPGPWTPGGAGDNQFAYDAMGNNDGQTGIFQPFARGCFWDNYSLNDGGGTSNQNTGCLDLAVTTLGPGGSFGNPGNHYTVGGWSGSVVEPISATFVAAGIDSIINAVENKWSVGDHAIFNTTLNTSLGVTAPSDEGSEAYKFFLQENGEGSAAITSITPQTDGPDLVAVNIFTGAGQVLIDTTQAITGLTQAKGGTAPAGITIPNGLQLATVSGGTLTPSVCSNLSQDVLTQPSSSGASTSETFTVSAPDSGTWNTTSPLMFLGGAYPENAVPSAVSGNTLTVSLHSQHMTGELVCQGSQAAMGLDQPIVDPSGRHYVQYATALSANTLVEGIVPGVTRVSTSLEVDGPINLYPLAIVVSGQMQPTAGTWDGILRTEPNPLFAVGDTLAGPTNISGAVSMHHETQFINSPYAYQSLEQFQANGMESMHGHNFLGVWDLNGNQQENLNVQTAGNHTLYAPHGFSVLENNGNKTNVVADLWSLDFPPVGGADYGNASWPHLLGVDGCWPSVIDLSKVRAISSSYANFDLFDFPPDGAHLAYTPSHCTGTNQPSGGDGSLTWTGPFNANSVTAGTGYFNNGLSVGAFGGGLYGVVIDSSANANFYRNLSVSGPGTSSFGQTTPTTIGNNGALSAPSVSVAGAISGATIMSSTAQVAGNITIGSGWGTGAAVTAVSGNAQRFRFTITAGTSPGANPTFSANFPVTYAATPVCEAQQTGGTGAIADITGDELETTTATGALTWLATPVASSTYIITVDCR